MSRRFVVIADTHTHPWSTFAKGDGLSNDRLRRTLAILDASLARAREEDVPWVHAGDLVHTAGYALNVVLSGVVDVLARYPDVDKYIVWGNHDARGSGGRIERDQTVLASLGRTIERFTILDGFDVCTESGLFVAGAGYQPRAEHLDLPPAADVGIFHQTLRGSVTAAGHTFTEGLAISPLLDRYRVAIVGHIHHPQTFDDVPEGQAVLVPGSPEHHNFGDSGDHGWWVIDLPEDARADPGVEFIDGGSPKFLTVDTPAGIEDDGNYYRVREVAAGETLPSNSTAIAPAPTTVEERDLLHGVSAAEEVLGVWMKENPPAPVLDSGDVMERGRELIEAAEPVRLRAARVRSLRLRNFCSYAEAELDVEEGTWLVVGEGRDYDSNGAGKSTLVGEALYWLLFGQNTKGLAADEVIRWGESECWVEADLDEADGTPLRIRRTRSSSGHDLAVETIGETGETIEWSAAGVTEMTKKLGRYLGVTPEIYQSLGYFSQEKLVLFSSATDGERKSILSDLIGLDAYQSAHTSAGSMTSKIETEQAERRARLSSIEGDLGDERVTLDSARKEEKEWEERRRAEREEIAARLAAAQEDPTPDEAKVQLDRIVARSDRLRSAQLARLESRREALVDHHETRLRSSTRARLERLREERDEIVDSFPGGSVERARDLVAGREGQADTLGEIRDEEERVAKDLRKAQADWNEINGRLSGLESTRAERVARAERIEASLAEGECPTCGQEVDDATRDECLAEARVLLDDVREKIRAAHSEREAVEARITSIQERLTSVERRLEAVERLLDGLDSLSASLARLDAVEGQIQDAEAADSEAARLAAEQADEEIERRAEAYRKVLLGRVLRARNYAERIAEEVERRIEETERDLAAVDARENPYTEAVASTAGRVERLDTRAADLADTIADADAERGIFQYWRAAFSKQGIQSLLVEEIAALFNAARSGIFPVLTQGVYDVQFSTLSRTASGEVRERTEFQIFEHGESIPYGALSGGQRRRVDVGIMLTLAVAVAKWMDTPGVLGLLVLDEVTGFLDASGAEGLVEALRVVTETIPTVYAITHETSLASMFPEVLRVEQDADGISRVA